MALTTFTLFHFNSCYAPSIVTMQKKKFSPSPTAALYLLNNNSQFPWWRCKLHTKNPYFKYTSCWISKDRPFLSPQNISSWPFAVSSQTPPMTSDLDLCFAQSTYFCYPVGQKTIPHCGFTLPF